MPRLVGLGRQVWQPGTYFRGFNPPSDPFLIIPEDSTVMVILVERNAWEELPGPPPGNVVLTFHVELSMDEGETWAQSASVPHPSGTGRLVTPTDIRAEFPGGIRFDLRGDEVTHGSVGPLLLPEPESEDRRARITMEVRVRLNTRIDIDLLP